MENYKYKKQNIYSLKFHVFSDGVLNKNKKTNFEKGTRSERSDNKFVSVDTIS